MNKKQKSLTNKGFSLVELIIVIAIMAVLVGVLAPQFIKYVEQSRRSTDIQNAENIKTAVLADIADGTLTGTGTRIPFTGTTDALGAGVTAHTTLGATTITNVPKIQGNLTNHNGNFYVTFDAVGGTCSVFPTDDATKSATYELTKADTANAYKTATSF